MTYSTPEQQSIMKDSGRYHEMRRNVEFTALLQKIEKPERVVLQAIMRYTTSCGPDGFCNSAAFLLEESSSLSDLSRK